MKNYILSIILMLASCYGYAIDLHRPTGAHVAGMGRTSVCNSDLWAVQNNPAGTAFLKGWQFGLYYENQWLLKETAFKHAVITGAFPEFGCIGLTVSQFGDSGYNESLFGLSYARAFGPYLQMGLQLNGLLFHWGEGYPNQWGADVALGIQSQLTEKLRLGTCLFHPIIRKLGTLQQEPLPVMMRLGLAYQFTDDFIGQCEIEHDDSREGFSLRGGMEYVLHERFWLRAGAQHNPDLLSFGVGYRLRQVYMDVSAQLHQALGASIQVEICYRVRSEE